MEDNNSNDAGRQRVRGFAAALLLLFLIGVSARVAVLGHSMDYLDNLMADDSFIYFAIARSLAAGQGPACAGVPTGGFQPLYAFLIMPLFASVPDDATVDVLDIKVRQTLVILIIFSTLCMVLIALLLYRMHGAGAAVLFGVSSWAGNDLVLHLTANGLETIVAVFCLLLCCYVLEFHNGPDARPVWRLLLGACLGLAGLARIDLLFLGAVVLVVFLWRAFARSQSARSAAVSLLLVGAGFSIIYLPWLAYIYSYTGRVYPVSGEAVRYLGALTAARLPAYYEYMMEVIGQAYYRSDPISIAVPAVAVPFAVYSWYRHRERWALGFLGDVGRLRMLLAMGAFVFLAYLFHIKVHWYLVRYVFPIYPALLLVTCAVVHRLDLALGPRGRAALLAVAAAGPLLMGALNSNVRNVVFGQPGPPNFRGAALAAKEMIPAGTVVGAWESGALSYYAPELEIVNLDGVVDEIAFEHLKNRTIDAYLRERGVVLCVGTKPGMFFVLYHSSVIQPNRFRELAVVPSRPGSGPWFVFGYSEKGHPQE
jgi:hypothetical protein